MLMSRLLTNTKNIFVCFVIAFLLSNCARDLSDNVYTSDTTLGLTLKGKIVSVRNVVIKESDRLSDNATGATAGALAGGRRADHGRQDGALRGARLAGVTVRGADGSVMGRSL